MVLRAALKAKLHGLFEIAGHSPQSLRLPLAGRLHQLLNGSGHLQQ